MKTSGAVALATGLGLLASLATTTQLAGRAVAAASLPRTTLTAVARDLVTLGGRRSEAVDIDGNIVVGNSLTTVVQHVRLAARRCFTTTSSIAGAALAAGAPIEPRAFAAASHCWSVPLLNSAVKRPTLSPQAALSVAARTPAPASTFVIRI